MKCNRLLLLSCLMGLIALVSSCDFRPKIPEPSVYWISISTGDMVDGKWKAPEHFTSGLADDRTVTSGGPVDGRILLKVNGNPVLHFTQAPTLLSVNEWLKPGENTVTFEGNWKKPIYVKIIQARMKGVQITDDSSIVARETIVPDPSKEANADDAKDADLAGDSESVAQPFSASMTFETYFEYELFVNQPEAEIGELTDDGKQEIRDFVKHFLSKANEQGADEFSNLVTEGFNEWSPAAYDTPEVLLKQFHTRSMESFTLAEAKFDEIDVNDLQFVPGRSVVMVFSNFDDQPPHDARLTTYSRKQIVTPAEETDDGMPVVEVVKSNFPPLHLARRDGKWFIWQWIDQRQ